MKLDVTTKRTYGREVKRKDRIAQLRQELGDANKDLDETNRALEELKSASDIDVEPAIHDYYKPLDEMKHYQNVTIGIAGFISAYALVKLL